jgi:hypothetical protein
VLHVLCQGTPALHRGFGWYLIVPLKECSAVIQINSEALLFPMRLFFHEFEGLPPAAAPEGTREVRAGPQPNGGDAAAAGGGSGRGTRAHPGAVPAWLGPASTSRWTMSIGKWCRAGINAAGQCPRGGRCG